MVDTGVHPAPDSDEPLSESLSGPIAELISDEIDHEESAASVNAAENAGLTITDSGTATSGAVGSADDSPDTDALPKLAELAEYIHSGALLAQPMTVAGTYHYLKRWQFISIIAVVWVIAAATGLGLYLWWYTSLDKTPAVFGVLAYLIVCTVASLLTSMISTKTWVAAVSIALISAPLASVAAAAVVHGAFFYEWVARPTVG